MKALLFSGGLDSTALAFSLKPNWALTIDYGQRAAKGELRAARQIAQHLGIAYDTISAPLGNLGSGDLAMRPSIQGAPASDWWPCRNQLLLTLAVPWALEREVRTLVLGLIASNRLHGDGSAAFVDAMNRALEVQGIAIGIEAPALDLSKAELLRRACVPLEVIAMAHSCQTGEFACGYCRACNAHRAAMEDLGFLSF